MNARLRMCWYYYSNYGATYTLASGGFVEPLPFSLSLQIQRSFLLHQCVIIPIVK